MTSSIHNNREEAIGLGPIEHSQHHLSFLLLFPIYFLLILAMAMATVIVVEAVEVAEAALLASFPLATEEAAAMQVQPLLHLFRLPSFLLLLSWQQASTSSYTTLAPVLASANLGLNVHVLYLDESATIDFNYDLFNSMVYLFGDFIICVISNTLEDEQQSQ